MSCSGWEDGCTVSEASKVCFVRYAIGLDGAVYERAIRDTPEQIRSDQRVQIRKRIRERYSVDDELAILRRAVMQGADSETDDYSQYVEGVIAEVRSGSDAPTHNDGD